MPDFYMYAYRLGNLRQLLALYPNLPTTPRHFHILVILRSYPNHDRRAALPESIFDDAGFVLQSPDGITFNVHSCIMRMVSSVSKDMLTIMRSEEDGLVRLSESKSVLATVLDMIYPARSLPPVMAVAQFRTVAVAADKYDMPSVTNALKFILLRKLGWSILSSPTETEVRSKST